ncbi:HDOD domain-containing protein [Thermodesulfobacteriota bacterium]
MAQIFNLVNMSDLPALDDNVTELLSLLANKNTTSKQLSQTILKDVSLTSKILQVVNSAYYARGTEIGSICRAITMSGLNTIRELASSIALFENFIKAGGDKKKVTNLLTHSYLSGNLAKSLCIKKKLRVSDEEAFICGLFHNLGELVVLTYLPDLYRRVEAEIEAGLNKDHAAREVLCDLTFSQVGMEVAISWNLLGKIVSAMNPDPPKPSHQADEVTLLMNIAAFSNQFTEQVNNGGHVQRVLERYYPTLEVDEKEAFGMREEIIETAGHSSKIISSGIRYMKLHSKLIVVARNNHGGYERVN